MAFRLPMLISLLFISLLPVNVSGAGTDSVVIRQIITNGNKITHPRIILRELVFATGDTLTAGILESKVKLSRENVLNTGLFNVVNIEQHKISDTDISVDIIVNVIERWYIWPMPYVAFPNNNLNAWLETTDFSKLTYGVNFKFFNMRGRNETLTAILHFGYNQDYGFTYKTPYLDKRQTWGFGFGGDAGLNKEIQVQTTGNKPVYLDTPGELLQQRYSGFAELFFRHGIRLYHSLRISYDQYFFADTLGIIPGFLPREGWPEEPITDLGFLSLYYKIKYDRRDLRYYPLEGFYWDLEIMQQGFSTTPINTISLKSSTRIYVPLSLRWHVAAGFTGMVSFPGEQYFFLARGLGYGRDFVRGYERYLIIGQHFAVAKSNIKFSILPRKVFNLDFIETQKFAVVPLGIYLNVFADYGYVYTSDPLVTHDNPLSNSSLFGYGAGIDVVTYYDVVVSMNFAMNLKGEPGFFLHFIAPI